MPCPAQCGYTGENLEHHYRHSPYCRPGYAQGPEAPDAKRARDFPASARLFRHQVTTKVSKEMLQAHIDNYVKMMHLDILRSLIVIVAGLVIKFIRDESNMGDVSLDEILKSAYAPFKEMPDASVLINRRRKIYQRAIPRPIGGGSFTSEAKKGAVRFDALQLITIQLQECKGARQEARKSSDLWKTGVLYGKKPKIVSDVIHGSRFYNWFAVCGKATYAERHDFRICLQGWIDAMTPLDGLSQRARKHKYTVLLGALINLPLRMRHYHDFVLLLLLYNNRYLKKHGDLVRALTGTGKDGTNYSDDVNLAAELELTPDEAPWISIPNDEDPAGPEEQVRLRIFLLVMSYDWLGGGEFGPWAESVSARFPCPRCHWAVKCPCAYLPALDPRQATVEHVAHCKRNAPRTHDEATQVIQELQQLELRPRMKTHVADRMKEEGIYSLHSTSQRLMRDMVLDTTIDTMHWGACGKTRYLFSWLTDILIPAKFSWEQLNVKKNEHKFNKGARVPDLERSKGDTRGSTSTHLSSGEMLNFALASPQIMQDLVLHDSPLELQHDSPWQCWLAHVAHLRFSNRHAYDLKRDQPECKRLQDNFLKAFNKVEAWRDRGKPKFHLGEHFSDLLGELGPFRHFNCLWGEAYLQIIKAMFRITNWKSAPYDVAVHWATKSVMHYRNSQRGTWYEDTVTPSSEFYFEAALPSLRSPIANAILASENVVALRFISSVCRGPDAVHANDWVLLDMPGVESMSARVETMVQTTYADTSPSYIRLYCTQARKLTVDEEFTQSSARSDAGVDLLVMLERTQLRVAACTVESTRYVFN